MRIKKDKINLLESLGFETRNDFLYQKFFKSGYDSIDINVCNREICFYISGMEIFPTEIDYVPTWAFLTLMKMYKLDKLEE